ADIGKSRLIRMMAAVNQNSPHDVVFAEFHAAWFHLFAREFERAKALAAHALELSEKNNYPDAAAQCRLRLGLAQSQLGYTKEGIRNIRQGTADLLKIGSRLGNGMHTQYLAEALRREGLLAEALEAI